MFILLFLKIKLYFNMLPNFTLLFENMGIHIKMPPEVHSKCFS